MAENPDVDALLALLDEEYPEPVDVFEDELARRLGVERHPGTPYALWRRRRVEVIAAAGEYADREARWLEDELLRR
jgi:hypothetical protein